MRGRMQEAERLIREERVRIEKLKETRQQRLRVSLLICRNLKSAHAKNASLACLPGGSFNLKCIIIPRGF